MTTQWQARRDEYLAGAEPPSPSHRRTRSTFNAKPWVEPPALEEGVAKYILSVMVIFLRQTSKVTERSRLAGMIDPASFPDFHSVDMQSPMQTRTNLTEPLLRHRLSQQAMNGHREASNTAHNFPIANMSFGPLNAVHSPSHAVSATFSALTISATASALPDTASYINWMIQKYSSRIVFHLSASNWPIVFARIRNKIHFLAGTSEEVPDMSEIKLVSCSALNKSRLVQVLQGASGISHMYLRFCSPSK
jgi:hypothetical protein